MDEIRSYTRSPLSWAEWAQELRTKLESFLALVEARNIGYSLSCWELPPVVVVVTCFASCDMDVAAENLYARMVELLAGHFPAISRLQETPAAFEEFISRVGENKPACLIGFRPGLPGTPPRVRSVIICLACCSSLELALQLQTTMAELVRKCFPTLNNSGPGAPN